MRKKCTLGFGCLLLALWLSLNLTVVPTFASGELTTSSTDQTSEQVVIIERDGVRYLSTAFTDETNPEPSPASTLADAGNPPQSDTFLRLPDGFFTDFGTLFNRLLRIVLAVAALLTLAFLILGAFKWITSGGDRGKTETARNTMIHAVIGLIVVGASYAILTLVLNFLGYSSLNAVIDQAVDPTPSPVVSPSPTPTT